VSADLEQVRAHRRPLPRSRAEDRPQTRLCCARRGKLLQLVVSAHRRNGAALVPVLLLVFVVARGHRLISSAAAFAPLELPASPSCPFLLLFLLKVSAQFLHCGCRCALSLAAFHGDHRGPHSLGNDEFEIRLPSSAPPTCRASAQRGGRHCILDLVLPPAVVDRCTPRVLSVVLVAFDLAQDNGKWYRASAVHIATALPWRRKHCWELLLPLCLCLHHGIR
jgi:hypothetical protein